VFVEVERGYLLGREAVEAQAVGLDCVREDGNG
jgi:hypothetical protein